MKKFLLIAPVFFLLSFSIPPKEMRHTIEITTSYGVIKLELYNETPLHRDNMLNLAHLGFYDSTMFHRVMKSFMIQGGDPDSKHAKAGVALGEGDLGYMIPPEFNANLIHKKGVLAAARQADEVNPKKKSSACQFYIVQGKTFTDDDLNKIESKLNKKYTPEQREIYKTIGGTPHLDGNYTVYGEVYEGLNVMDSIANVKTDRGDRPLEDVRMTVKEGPMIKVAK